MAQKLLSISLGTTSAKLAEISKAGKKVQVFSAYDIPISEGICDDGVILDVDALAEELKHFISKYRIKSKDLVFSIASKRIASKEVIIPYVKEKQIMSIVEINAPEYFPVANISEYALNYSIIELIKSPENTQYRINVTATPIDILKGYDLLASQMKRSIEVIDYSGNAILQVLKSQTEAGSVNAILQLGYENTVINIMNGGIQIMQRTISTGLNAIISSVCESVGLDEEEAVAFLEDNDISKIAGAYPDVKYVVDSLITSIGRIFDFYNGRSAEHPVAGVKFIGDATYVNGIGPALEAGLGFPTDEIFTLNNVSVKGRQITPEFATNFMANIGAIIQPMNLKYVDPEEKDKTKEKEGKLPWGLVILSFVASVALIGGSLAMYYMAKQERDMLQMQLDSVAAAEQIEKTFNEANAKKLAVENLYKSTQGPNDLLLRMINDMERVMPSGVSVEAFSLSEGVVTMTGGGTGKNNVARFIQQMRDLEYVDDVRVDLITETLDSGTVYDSFTMSFKLVEVESSEENAGENAGEQPETLEIDIPVENTEIGGNE